MVDNPKELVRDSDSEDVDDGCLASDAPLTA